MLDKHEYYCKIFVNKDIEQNELEILIDRLVKKEKQIRPWMLDDIDININKASKHPLGKVDEGNFLYWKFFLDVEPTENSSRKEYIDGIAIIMHDLRHNGFQVIAACSFEDELPRYDDKNFELAYRIYPLPKGTTYFKSDLMDEKSVEILFDYCQIMEAIIFKVGWEFLIEFYGYEKLYEINERSGWFWAENMDEFLEYVEMNMGYCEGKE